MAMLRQIYRIQTQIHSPCTAHRLSGFDLYLQELETHIYHILRAWDKYHKPYNPNGWLT